MKTSNIILICLQTTNLFYREVKELLYTLNPILEFILDNNNEREKLRHVKELIFDARPKNKRKCNADIELDEKCKRLLGYDYDTIDTASYGSFFKIVL